ncbi:HNH endonuclease [Photobacterium phosphoreum]|uniref:HNH endonuclease n=1 Tax=Photobacterium phosphoreum TaxID=659 RepID=UPI000D183A85|nr:HNH endonuclease [Photobacterium phosphoreum]PSU83749.1 HNH endonuclease [Photobacterium phosphoreum]
MKYLFCNVGWMNNYDGIDGDSLERGGSYNQDEIGHEVCNFTMVGDQVYGYVRPTGQIKLENFGALKNAKSIENVLVIWTAGPDSGGTAVVGWYKDATVFRYEQMLDVDSPRHDENGLDIYRIKAHASNVTLLPLNQRSFMIPRAIKGGIGQSNVWFASSKESEQFITPIFKFIESYNSNDTIPDIDFSATEGNPRLLAHIKRERNQKLVQAKKKQVLEETGSLACEVCGFDFKHVYGELGADFCEVHHLKKLADAEKQIETSLLDLAIVCSNCHRVIHRTKQMKTISKIKEAMLLEKDTMLKL